MSWTTLRDDIDTYMAALVPSYGSSAYRSIIKGGLFEATAKGVVDEITGSIPSSPRSQTYAFNSSPDGWTLVNGSGTSSISGGKQVLTNPTTTSANFTTGPRCYRDHGMYQSGCTVIANVASWTGGNTINHKWYLETGKSTMRWAMAVDGLGNTYTYNGSAAGLVVSATAGAIDIAGNGWVAIRIQGNFVSWWYANGTGGNLPSPDDWVRVNGTTATSFGGIQVGTGLLSTGAAGAFTVATEIIYVTEDAVGIGATI